MSDDHVGVNRASWDEDAPNWVERGRRSWASYEDPSWGWYTESQLHLLPDVSGLDAVELGCGTGYISSWLKRRGARVVGLDNSSKQLATAVYRDHPLILMRSARRSPTRASTSRSPNTAPRSGAIPTGGSPKRRGSFVPVAG